MTNLLQGRMMGPWFHWGFAGWWLMPVGMIVFWGLIIWGIIALLRANCRRSGVDSGAEHARSAMEILKARYVRGEITREEFEEKKQAIS